MAYVFFSKRGTPRPLHQNDAYGQLIKQINRSNKVLKSQNENKGELTKSQKGEKQTPHKKPQPAGIRKIGKLIAYPIT